MRINVQLIDATTDAHMWAETYDRELVAANIFAIQTELAAAIAGALKASLTPGEQARALAMHVCRRLLHLLNDDITQFRQNLVQFAAALLWWRRGWDSNPRTP